MGNYAQRGKSPAIVLLSGGMDSAASAAIAQDRGFEIFALTIHYGQRHSVECEAAARVAQNLQIQKHVYQHCDLRAFGGSALTDEIDVPKTQSHKTNSQQIPVTYVPARNTIFLSFALAFAEVNGARDIFVGMNALDYAGYPDCRPEFIAAFEALARVATKAGAEGDTFRIHAPLMHMNKADIVREGARLGVDFSLTHSCYDPTPEGLACGRCDSCFYRIKGFNEAGVTDPTRYASQS